MTTNQSVAVIIAAYNAESTIATAIRSALSEPEVAELLIVDDNSADRTVEVARSAGVGDDRVKILRQDINCGPSAARNRGVRESTAPYISILDADDLILPGRFAELLAIEDWDFCADNIVFYSSEQQLAEFLKDDRNTPKLVGELTFENFVYGNICRKGQHRGELGFLKPVFRREFVEQRALTYHEECRLGEDFLFYAEALAKNARFKVHSRCRYAALVRPNSLSGKHSASDLKNLYGREEALLDSLGDERAKVLKAHAENTRRRWAHRDVLDIKAKNGLLAGILAMIKEPTVIGAILRDRLRKLPPNVITPRKLLPDEQILTL